MNRCDDRHALDTAHVEERTSRHCLAASCAMALHVLFELDRVATEVVVQTGLAAMSGGATFGNAGSSTPRRPAPLDPSRSSTRLVELARSS